MKTVVITGANSGLGFETAKKIAASKEYRVILACRNDAKAAQAKADIIAATGNDAVETLRLDTSLLSSVREFANNYIKAYGTVDVLINNAGISPMRDSGTTEEGFEVVFATNYLGHFNGRRTCKNSCNENYFCNSFYSCYYFYACSCIWNQ